MATVSLTPNQYQQLIDRISELETWMVTLHNHAETQQEQIRVAEVVIQQLRAAGTTTNPSPQPRTAQKQVTEGGAFKALTRYTGNPSEYHDLAFSARRVITRANERFGGLLQWISGQIDEIKESDLLEYRRTAGLSTTDMDWLDLEMYALLSIKTSDTALASIKSLEEAEVKGIIGWQRLEREARGYHRHRVALLTDSVTHPEKVQKVTYLPQAFYRWESNLKEFQRGRPAELDDDVKANAMRHMMPKEILEAVDLQPQYRTFCEIRKFMLQQARQRADVFVGDVCRSTKKVANVTSRANTNTSPTTKTTSPVSMDVSQMSSKAFKNESVEQESDSYQYEPDQEGDGDELFTVKGKGKGGFKETCFKCGMRGHKADRCWQKGKGKGGKRDWEKGKGG